MNCPECEKKDKRISELEGMIERMAESYDNYQTSRDWERTVERVITEGVNTFQNGKVA